MLRLQPRDKKRAERDRVTRSVNRKGTGGGPDPCPSSLYLRRVLVSSAGTASLRGAWKNPSSGNPSSGRDRSPQRSGGGIATMIPLSRPRLTDLLTSSFREHHRSHFSACPSRTAAESGPCLPRGSAPDRGDGYCSTPQTGVPIASPMPFRKPETQENSSFRQEWPGMLIFFVVMTGMLPLAHHFKEPVMEWLSLKGNTPGQEPPWYFINRDFAEGICSAGALALSLICAASIWRWWPRSAITIVWMSLIWLGGDVAQGWIIFQHCPGLLEGHPSTTRWLTFDSYIGDPLIDGYRTVILLGSVLFSFVLPIVDRHFRKRRSGPGGPGNPTELPAIP